MCLDFEKWQSVPGVPVVFLIYQYETGIWWFLILLGVVWYDGMEKLYLVWE